MAWLRRYHSLEFYVALFNQQPTGFWDLDTLKQDARRLGLRVAHPDVNLSELLCVAQGADRLRLGLTFVKGVDARLGAALLRARESGEFGGLSDVLARSGAMNGLGNVTDRSAALWRVGAGYVSGVRRGQLALPMDAWTFRRRWRFRSRRRGHWTSMR